jgi:hypothetical protein
MRRAWLLVLLTFLAPGFAEQQWDLASSEGAAREAKEGAIVNDLQRQALAVRKHGAPCKLHVHLSRLTLAHLQQTADSCAKTNTLSYKLALDDRKEGSLRDELGAVIDRFIAPRPWWSVDIGSGPSEVVLRRFPNPQLEKYLRWWASVQYPSKEACRQRTLLLYNDLGRYWASLAHVTAMEFGMQDDAPCGNWVQNGVILDIQMAMKKTEFSARNYCSQLPGRTVSQTSGNNLWRCFFLPLSSCDTAGDSKGAWEKNENEPVLALTNANGERTTRDQLREALIKTGQMGQTGKCKFPVPSAMGVGSGEPMNRFLGLAKWTVHYPRYNTTKVRYTTHATTLTISPHHLPSHCDIVAMFALLPRSLAACCATSHWIPASHMPMYPCIFQEYHGKSNSIWPRLLYRYNHRMRAAMSQQHESFIAKTGWESGRKCVGMHIRRGDKVISSFKLIQMYTILTAVLSLFALGTWNPTTRSAMTTSALTKHGTNVVNKIFRPLSVTTCQRQSSWRSRSVQQVAMAVAVAATAGTSVIACTS